MKQMIELNEWNPESATPECYCFLENNRSGEKWFKPIFGRQMPDVVVQGKKMIRALYSDYIVNIGVQKPSIGTGDYTATVYTDGRKPNCGVCWGSADMFIKVVE